ncbi:glycine cleavage system protein H [Streptococcus thoraltensis]|uniref:glycine cleavage system protein H n=1 Tax=Streptococcus thoraltensis TaxID=55085 RepID=UPI001F572D41|nr:biotin/lipoyl-containing protein [Streptococcus thoraltensis]
MAKVANSLLITKEEDLYRISMTPELQDVLGNIAYIDFTEEDTIDVDDSLLNLESSKAVMELTSPLAGTIVSRNEAAGANPDLLNQADASKNWIVVLSNVDEAAYNALEDPKN